MKKRDTRVIDEKETSSISTARYHGFFIIRCTYIRNLFAALALQRSSRAHGLRSISAC